MKKKFTADELYELLTRSTQIKWNEDYFWVHGCNEEEVYLFDDDGEEYFFNYNDMVKELNDDENSSITFYELKEIEIN